MVVLSKDRSFPWCVVPCRCEPVADSRMQVRALPASYTHEQGTAGRGGAGGASQAGPDTTAVKSRSCLTALALFAPALMDTTMNADVGDNLWSSILDSVQSGSRSVSTKNLIVLGAPLSVRPCCSCRGFPGQPLTCADRNEPERQVDPARAAELPHGRSTRPHASVRCRRVPEASPRSGSELLLPRHGRRRGSVQTHNGASTDGAQKRQRGWASTNCRQRRPRIPLSSLSRYPLRRYWTRWS